MEILTRPGALLFVIALLLLASCSIERRHYLPGYHIEGRMLKVGDRSAKCEVRETEEAGAILIAEACAAPNKEAVITTQEINPSLLTEFSVEHSTSPAIQITPRSSTFSPSTSRLLPSISILASDTLKKPFKPQKQYREIDPVGEMSVGVVLGGLALQKIAGILTWFEVIVPLSFGPGVFIPAFIIVLIGLGMSVASAYRVRKYPEKYKKNQWGKAALAILGWQIIMSALFAWLLGGLPIL